MKKQLFSVLLLTALVGCNPSENQKKMTENIDNNPLLVESTLPYGAPDFSKIKDEHYRPALLKGMALQNERIAAITSNNEAPTFENTIIALEKSGVELERASAVFNALTEAHTNDTLKVLQKELSPKFAEHADGIHLNEKLFARIKALYDQRNSLQLDAESLKLLENYYEDFVVAGANLSTTDKETLKKYNSELASLETDFNQTLLEGSLAAVQTINGQKVAIVNTTQQPLLSELADRNQRKQLFEAAWNRTDGGAHNTNDILKRIALPRAKKAELLGFKN